MELILSKRSLSGVTVKYFDLISLMNLHSTVQRERNQKSFYVLNESKCEVIAHDRLQPWKAFLL